MSAATDNADSELVLSTINDWRTRKPAVGADGVAMLDLSGISQLDSAGVALLVQWASEFHAQQARLLLKNANSHQRALVTLCGVDDLLL